MQQHVTDGDRNDQQVAEAAANAAGCVEDHPQHADIQHRQDKQVEVTPPAMQRQRNQYVDEQVDPAGLGVDVGVADRQHTFAQGRAGQ